MKYFIITFVFLWLNPIAQYAQLSEGLVLSLNLDGDAIDSSVNENHGLIINAISTEDKDGNLNSALYFDGSASIVLVNSESIKPELPLTLSLSIKLDNLDGPRPL